jgi:hypothetical protein
MHSDNCQACGSEEFEKDLVTVKLASFHSSLRICKKCLKKNAEDSFKDAAGILSEITKLAESGESAEKRLSRIRKILG